MAMSPLLTTDKLPRELKWVLRRQISFIALGLSMLKPTTDQRVAELGLVRAHAQPKHVEVAHWRLAVS